MERWIDLEKWPRKAHYLYFREYEQPFFNVCVHVNVGSAYERRHEEGESFFLKTLYSALVAANGIPAFRRRLRPNGVIEHDRVHGGSTVLNGDETFSFCYFEFGDGFPTFSERAKAILDAHRQKKGGLEPEDDRDDLIHFSVLPWLSFTGLQHARRINVLDSTPKIVFGKVFDGHRMPVSLDAHHALMDGLHASRFFERFEEIMCSWTSGNEA